VNLLRQHPMGGMNPMVFGVMEDNRRRRKRLSKILEGRGFRVRHIRDADEAVELAEAREVESFLLDIHMGKRRAQEGLDALERIKEADQSIFVAMYSAYPQSHRVMAENLEADCFVEKTADEEGDVARVLEKLEERTSSTQFALPALQQLRIPMGAALETDKNVVAFRQLIKNDAESARFRDQYVGFVNGELVGNSRDQSELLRDLREQYPDTPRFVARVTRRMAHLPTPLGVRPYIHLNEE
jgi:CheY-like chemotaxis protein